MYHHIAKTCIYNHHHHHQNYLHIFWGINLPLSTWIHSSTYLSREKVLPPRPRRDSFSLLWFDPPRRWIWRHGRPSGHPSHGPTGWGVPGWTELQIGRWGKYVCWMVVQLPGKLISLRLIGSLSPLFTTGEYIYIYPRWWSPDFWSINSTLVDLLKARLIDFTLMWCNIYINKGNSMQQLDRHTNIKHMSLHKISLMTASCISKI